MDAPETRPETPAPDTDLTDPIGPPQLPKLPRRLIRSLALTGVAVGVPLISMIVNTETGTPTGNC